MSKKLRDVGAVVVSRMSTQLVGLIVTPLAARILTKDELGAWAIILIITGFGATLGDAGLPSYVVRERDWTAVRRASVLWLSLAVGTAVTSVLLFLAGPLCEILGISESKSALSIATASLIPSVAGSVMHAELRKQLRFNAMLAMDVSASVLLLLIVCFGLSSGYGIDSYAWGTLVTAIAQFALGIGLTGPIALTVSRSAIRSITGYTGGLVGFNGINYWARRLDQVLINHFLGVAAVAQYSVAYRLMMLPITHINSLFHLVLLPYLAPHQDDAATLRKMMGRALQMIGIIITPPMTLLWLAKYPIVDIYLGTGWDPAAELLGIFALIGILQAFVNPIGIIYQICGRTRRFFFMGVINTAVVSLSFIVGIAGGLEGIAIAYFLANLLMIYPTVTAAYRVIGVGIGEWLRYVWPFGLIPSGSFLIFSCLNKTILPGMELASAAIGVSSASLALYLSMFKPILADVWREVSVVGRRIDVDGRPAS